jgi:methyl-accepting chemotaxis protein
MEDRDAKKTASLKAKVQANVAVVLVLLTLICVMTAGVGRGLRWATLLNAKSKAVSDLNDNFQLAVSKAKNFCILQDAKNRDVAQAYLAAAHQSMQTLQSLSGPEEQAYMGSFQESLDGIQVRMDALFKEDLRAAPSPRALYARHLKDVTAPFDKATGDYRGHLHDLAVANQDNLFAKGVSAQDGVYIAVGLALLALVSMLLVARTLTVSVLKPIAELVDALKDLSKGVLNRRMAVRSQDEMGQLAEAFNRTGEGLTINFKRNSVDWNALAAEAAASQQLQAAEAARVEDMRAKVEQILGAVHRASEGDLTARAPFRGEDALGKVADGMNRLLGAFSQELGAISRNAEELRLASQHLDGLAQDIEGSAGKTSAQMDSLNQASDVINENVRSVAAATEQMNTAIKEIAGSAGNAASIAAEGVDLMRTTDETVRKLSASSTEISEVVKVITSIAQQTNLLALNATVEAARAGESGKGFAVVASEVKDLARETARAAEDIGRKISAIQHSGGETVAVIGKVADSIERINGYQSGIASAVEEQSVATQDISRNINNAANGTADVRRHMAGMADTAKDNAGLSTDLKSSSDRLSAMATQMKGLIAKFRFDAEEALPLAS